MNARRFEIVRSEAGWFARFVAGNSAKVWQTEVYARRRTCLRAIELVTGMRAYNVQGSWFITIHRTVEIREVDERAVPDDVDAGGPL